MEILNEIKMDNSEENNEEFLQNNTHHCEQIMLQGTASPNTLSGEIQVDGQSYVENFVFHVPIHGVFQCKEIISQSLNEMDQINRSSNQFKTKYEESSSNISSENNMLNKNQDYPIDLSSSAPLDLGILKDKCGTYSTNNEVQRSNVVYDIDEYNIPTTANNFQNSIYIRDIDQTSSSYGRNSNLNPIIQPSHPVNNPFSCKTCNKKYTSKRNLKRHLEAHIRKNKFFCTVCNKQLAKKEYFNHMLDHSIEKPFICSVCNSQFTEKFNMKRHMLNHTGEKPFSCSTCNRRFTTKQNLDGHEMTHTGVKPHKCHLCEKKYRYKCDLNKHIKTHRKELERQISRNFQTFF